MQSDLALVLRSLKMYPIPCIIGANGETQLQTAYGSVNTLPTRTFSGRDFQQSPILPPCGIRMNAVLYYLQTMVDLVKIPPFLRRKEQHWTSHSETDYGPLSLIQSFWTLCVGLIGIRGT